MWVHMKQLAVYVNDVSIFCYCSWSLGCLETFMSCSSPDKFCVMTAGLWDASHLHLHCGVEQRIFGRVLLLNQVLCVSTISITKHRRSYRLKASIAGSGVILTCNPHANAGGCGGCGRAAKKHDLIGFWGLLSPFVPGTLSVAGSKKDINLP